MSTTAVSQPNGLPVSNRSTSRTTPWNGLRAACARSASVSWISPPAPGCDPGDLVEHVGREHVAADDDEVARRHLRLRLLDHVADRDHAGLVERTGRIDHAVGADLLVRHLLQPDDAAPRWTRTSGPSGRAARASPSARRGAGPRTARRGRCRPRSRRRGRALAARPGRRSSPARRARSIGGARPSPRGPTSAASPPPRARAGSTPRSPASRGS